MAELPYENDPTQTYDPATVPLSGGDRAESEVPADPGAMSKIGTFITQNPQFLNTLLMGGLMAALSHKKGGGSVMAAMLPMLFQSMMGRGGIIGTPATPAPRTPVSGPARLPTVEPASADFSKSLAAFAKPGPEMSLNPTAATGTLTPKGPLSW